MVTKKYFFYVKDPELQKTLDELKRHKMFAEIIQDVLKNGLQKQIMKKVSELKKLNEKLGKKK